MSESISDSIIERHDITSSVTHVRWEPGNGTTYDMVITRLPPGVASATNIVNVYGYGAVWMGDPRTLRAGYLREKMPLLSYPDSDEIVKMVRHIMLGK
jgi:hypothetical protein